MSPTHSTHTKDGYAKQIQAIIKILKCVEVQTNVQLKCFWYPPWNTGALRRSRLLLLAPDLHLSRPRWCPTSPLCADSVRFPALAGPALHSALPNRKADIIDRKIILLNPKRRKTLTVHQRRQQLSLLICTNRATQRHQLMTSGTDHSGSGIGTKLICKPNKTGKNL